VNIINSCRRDANYSSNGNDRGITSVKRITYVFLTLILIVFSIFSANENNFVISNGPRIDLDHDTLYAEATSVGNQEARTNLSQGQSQLQQSLNQNLNISSDLEVTINSGKQPATTNFKLAQGYQIEPVLWNLTFPSSITFDGKGTIYIAEAGYAGYQQREIETTPRILMIDANGTISTLVARDLYGPITDIEYHDGKIYASNRGKISAIDASTGKVEDIIMALPSLGDNPVDEIAFGPDGRLYAGIGSATNSGVVGEDNDGWLKLQPSFHDIPGKDIKLTGQNFNSSNPLTPLSANDKNTTGAFSTFGTSISKGQLVKGYIRCNACIISAQPDGTDLKLVAWGMRDPSGFAFDKEGRLMITDAGAEDIGSRPIANDSDKVHIINISNYTKLGKWYGWPDFFGNGEPVTSGKFNSKSANQLLQFMMQNHPQLEKPFSLTNDTNGISQVAISNSSIFGLKGMSFVAESGIESSSPSHLLLQMQKNNISAAKENVTSEVTKTTKGQKITILNPKTKRFEDFITLNKPDPSFRPVGLKFNDDGSALYITSIGKQEIRTTSPTTGFPLPKPLPWFYQHTGTIWKVTNSSAVVGMAANQPPKELRLSPELSVTINSGSPPDPGIFKIPEGYKIEPVLWNLDLPGSFAFDNRGNMYIASTGITYGKVTANPTIIKVDKNGTVSPLASKFLHGVLADIEFNKDDGLLYVSHRALVSTVNLTSGLVKDIVTALPKEDYGTHPMGQLAIGPDKRVYFGVGSLSNTAVPDISDFGIGWIRDMPQMHEIPGQDIILTGQNFMSDNFLTAEPNDKVITGGLMPFGTPAREGEVIKGDKKCMSCILSIKPDGSDLRLEAWGVRNPYGLVIHNDTGRVFITNNGEDDKGIRRVTNQPDAIFSFNIFDKSRSVKYFGYPDFVAIGKNISDPFFNQSPKQNYTNQPLIKNPPPLTKPYMLIGQSVGVGQAAISTNDSFGFKGMIFISDFGTIAPVTHQFQVPKQRNPGELMGQIIGQKIAIVDPNNRSMRDFIALNTNIPDFRPVGLQFSPDGSVLYIASIEKEEIRKVTPTGAPLSAPSDYPYLKTGVIWKVTRDS
jgi:glucose/arabinose dehydrogenase